MLNKNVCPKCGQLYDLSLAACPVCNTPAQIPAEAEAPTQRRRLTEVERRQRQQEQKREAAEARRREREQRRAADAEEERLLEEEEERLWKERQRKKLEKRGLSEDEITEKLDASAEEKAPKARREKAENPDDRDPARTPAIFPAVAIVLLIAALLVGGSYLLWNYKLVNIPLYDNLSGTARTVESTETACTALTLGEQNVELTAAGQTYALEFTRQPATCTQPVTFRTSDESVAMVGELGIITAVAPGTATITATCGSIEASCVVTCSFEATASEAVEIDPSEGLVLSDTDITFREAGENTYLSVTNLPAGATVFWASSNEEVATVEENGHVVAVGRGTCYITAVVNDYTESCIVRCNFED